MDYYKLLDINNKASRSDIKKAYRRKAVEYHPDTNKSKNAPEMFKSIKIAYDTLYNENTRIIYDRSLVVTASYGNAFNTVYARPTYNPPPKPVVKIINIFSKGVGFLNVRKKINNFSDVIFMFDLDIKNLNLEGCYTYPMVRTKAVLLFEDNNYQLLIKCPEHRGVHWIEVVDKQTDFIVFKTGNLSRGSVRRDVKLEADNMNKELISFLEKTFGGI